jgi:hypothetical protein
MIDYSQWPRKTIDIIDIDLDPKNPRVSIHDKKNMDQAKLFEHFCTFYKIFELSKSIIDNGYFPEERLIVCEEDKKLIVLEGNRRVAALRILINPNLAPGHYKEKFQHLV